MPHINYGRYSRFLFSIVPGIVLLLVTLFVADLVNSRIAGGIGLTIALITAICLPFGVLLLYWNAVDWFNLRTIRGQLAAGTAPLKDGTTVAFSGVVRSDDEPLVAPITGQACAAYISVVAISRTVSAHHKTLSQHKRRSRIVILQSFHLNRTQIEGDKMTLALGSLPGFETDLRESDSGDKWAEQVHAQIANLAHLAERTTDIDRESLLQSLQNTVIDECHHDFCRNAEMGNHSQFVVDEEVLPIDTDVTVIGTYDQQRGALIARNSRLGPNLMIYKGSMVEVLARIGGEITWYAKFVTAMLGFSVVVVTLVLLPDSWLSYMPLLKILFIPNS